MHRQTVRWFFCLILICFSTDVNGQVYVQGGKGIQNRVQTNRGRLQESQRRTWKLNNGQEIRHFVQPPKNKHQNQKRSPFIDPLLALRLQRELAIQRALIERHQGGFNFGSQFSRSRSSYSRSFGNNFVGGVRAANTNIEADGRVINVTSSPTEPGPPRQENQVQRSKRIRSPFADFSDGSTSVLEAIEPASATEPEFHSKQDH